MGSLMALDRRSERFDAFNRILFVFWLKTVAIFRILPPKEGEYTENERIRREITVKTKQMNANEI